MPDRIRNTHSVLAQHLEFGVPFGIRRREHAAIPGAHNLARMKRKAGDVTARPSDLLKLAIPCDLAAHRARRILHYGKAMTAGNLEDSSEIARHPHLVHAQNGACMWRQDGLDLGRIKVEGVRFDINENGCRSAIADSIGGGDVGMTDGNYFVTRLHPDGEQRKMKRGGAIRDRTSARGTDEGREL